MIKIHCQPSRPNQFTSNSINDTGAPSARLNGTATSNPDNARERSLCANQCVKYTMMPGKNPASATPRTNRAQ